MADVRVGHADYPRPCIVSTINTDGTAWVYPLSTKDYSERWQMFRIDSHHPDFAATGLSATSFTIHPAKLIPIAALGKKRGDLIGELAREFDDWR